jgi:hypothetical protein
VAQLLPVASLGLFGLLLFAFVFVLRRAAELVARTRELDAFREAGSSVVDRAVAQLAIGAERIDRVRRRQDPPQQLDPVLVTLLDALGGLRAEADALAAPPTFDPLRVRIVEEVDRTMRAVEVVKHGCTLLGAGTRRPSSTEGETSIKRGYLNVLHGREALIALGADLRAGRLDASRWYSDRLRPS